MGDIVTDVHFERFRGVAARYPVMSRSDHDAYDEMESKGRFRYQDINLEGTIFDPTNKDSGPDPKAFVKFFMALGAFGIMLWAGSRVVSYYALWMPALEDFDYDYFQYGQAMDRYVEILFAADAWGLFLAFVAIIGVLTLIINEMYR